MKIFTLIVLFFFAPCPLLSQGNQINDVSIFTRFSLQVIEDDKPTESFIVGHLNIYQVSDIFNVSWYDVWISPIHEKGQVLLKPEYSSLDRGDIRDLSITNEHFSFTFVLDAERLMYVSGSKETGNINYKIQAIGIWWIDLLKKNVKTEWRPTSKPIVLPYNELF